MRWVLVLIWLLVVGHGQAEAPMDLDSPFEKTALVSLKAGDIEKREIKKAKRVGTCIEMEKIDGGIFLIPTAEVLAIVPRLPSGNLQGTLAEIEAAIRLLKDLPADLASRAGIDSAQMQAWENLQEIESKKSNQKKEEEQKKLKQEVDDWLAQATEFRVPRTQEELTDLKQKGEALARRDPGHKESLLIALAVLSQVQPKEKGGPLPDLSKLNEIQPQLVPDDLLGWLAGGVSLVSFFGLLFGLAFFSSSLSRFKDGALLGGIVFGALSLALIGILIWTWLPATGTGQSVAPRADPKLEELSIYLKNRAKPVYYFPKKQFSFSMEEWKSGVLAYLPASEEAVGLFKVKMKQGDLRLAENGWNWQQPLTAFGIPLPLSLTIQGENPDLKDWENPTITGVYLGRWVLPDAAAGLLKDSAVNIWKQGLTSAGLAGINLEKSPSGMIMVSVPAAGVMPKYELAKEEVREEVKEKEAEAYRKEISAEDLAVAFMQGKGQEFSGKFILIDGMIEKLSSGSEVSGGAVASKGEGLPSAASSIGAETFDIFYLCGARVYGHRKDPLYIKCLIKSSQVYVMDSFGDVYLGPRANTLKDKPLIKKGYRAKFLKEGRVQSDKIQNNEIEVYGIELDGPGDLRVYDPNEPARN